MADLGKEVLVLEADPTPFEQGLESASKSLGAFGKDAGKSPAHDLPAPKVMPMSPKEVAGFGDSLGKVIDEQEAPGKAAGALADKYKDQAATFGMAGRQLEIYKAKLAGATDEELAAAKAADKHLTALEKQKGGLFGLSGKTTQTSIMAAQVTGGAVKSVMSGEGKTAAGAVGIVGQFASLLPGPLGSIASLITGTLSGVLDMLTEQSRKTRAAVGDAFEGMTNSAQTATQALNGMHAKRFGEEFRTAIDYATAHAGEMSQVRSGLFGNENANDTHRAEFVRLSARAYERAADAEALFRQIQPDVQRAARPHMIRMAANSAMDQSASIAQGAQRSGFTGAQLAAGASTQEAADAATRLGMAQQLAAQSGLSLAEAQARLAPQLTQVAEAQRLARTAGANLEIGQSIAAGREEVALSELRVAHLRDARGITADMSQEQATLNRLIRQGASAEMVTAAQDSLNARRNQRVREEAMRQGRSLREEVRNPMEQFQEESQRLEQLRVNGAIDEETYRRGVGRNMDRLTAAAGEAPVGQAALAEGSAAAVSAIYRAQRQQQREDPQARMVRATAELRAVAERQRQIQQQQLEMFRRGDVFRAINGL